MQSLTLALAALGGVVLAGIVAHGAWQARRAGPRRAVRESSALTEAPNDSREMREPVFDPPVPVEVDPTMDFASSPLDVRPSKRFVARLDALIDVIAPMTIESPVTGEMVLLHMPTTRRAGSKPFLIEGLNAETNEWDAPVPGQRYSEFQAGVQLANRTGAINEIEYSEFVQKVQSFAEAVGAMADFPDMLDVVARARELDAFASEHDAQLAVHLRSQAAAWSVGYIQQYASRHGFVAGVVPGRLVMPSGAEGAPAILTLTFDSQAAFADDPNLAAVRDLTLSFDVPQTEPQASPFDAWQTSAQALAADMDAAIVDDHGRALSPEGFAAIGDELKQLYAQLEARDLAAGSAAARRLFS